MDRMLLKGASGVAFGPLISALLDEGELNAEFNDMAS